MDQRVCAEEGCDRADMAGRGLCGRHYQLHKYRGDLDEVAPKYRSILCAWCGTEFLATQRKSRFCSQECWHKANYEKSAPERRTICGHCGGPIVNKSRRAKYCSTKCEQDARNDRARQVKIANKPPCEHCGQQIPLTRRVYCSYDCKQQAARALKYGLTSDELRTLLDQHDQCAICGTSEWGRKGPQVDHCHDSGKVRGILCVNCNTVLGHAHDDTDYLRAAIAYLESHTT